MTTDGVNELVLADLKMDGETVPAMMKADRNGFFFVTNRETGKILSAEKYVPTTWAEKWDVADGRAVEDPDKRAGPGHPAKGACPNLIGGKNWQPMSYNPETGLVYIPSNNLCMDWSVSEPKYKRGVMYLGGEFPPGPSPRRVSRRTHGLGSHQAQRRGGASRKTCRSTAAH